MKRNVALLLLFALLLTAFCGCGKKATVKNTALDLETPVKLTISAPWSECKALDRLCGMFSEEHPNVSFVYEYVQDYYDSIATRMAADTPSEDKIDLFITTNIQPQHALYPYALELYGRSDALDLGETFPGLINNFSVYEADGAKSLYTVPLGADLRGMFVNKTLLASLGLEVPTNLAELKAACAVLRENGYIPLQGNPGYFGQRFLYPYICNLVANSPAEERIYEKTENCEEGVSECFREPLRILYDFVADGDYNYKYVEKTDSRFTDSADDATARDFFDIIETDGSYTKNSDLGAVAFMPGTSALIGMMDKTKEDYHSAVDYEFILSPVGEEGGYAYMSPTHGISVCKNSEHTDWALEFMNFLFTAKNNEVFAEAFNCTPNTADAFAQISSRFTVPPDRVSELGQVTFSYGFYSLINESLLEISKANNPKYMNTDADGNPVMYDFAYYMAKLEARFAEQRTKTAEE